ncbi:MAG: helical backbone metal receptor [Rubritalea sp.]|uniref:ABC transporter substrate-binding protein n=1 Tax=Rubritalea sp. TaxID=2109375 RepID=UPI003242E35E
MAASENKGGIAMRFAKLIGVSLLVVASFLGSYWLRRGAESESQTLSSEARIVTMAPSSGEVVFALGLGDQVVGVSRFASYPPEVMDKAKVGGYLDVDLEAIVRLKPNVVVLLKEQADLAQQLENLGMGTMLVDHMSVDGILASITKLGERFGKAEEARVLRESLESRIEKVRMAARTKPHKKLLLSIGRELGVGKVTGVVAAGAGGYHQQLLEIAGYTNAYRGSENFPQLSREHLIRMNPEIIIDMVNVRDAEAIGVENIKADWKSHPELVAVQNGKVFLLLGDEHFVPGPRFVATLEWIAECEERGAE